MSNEMNNIGPPQDSFLSPSKPIKTKSKLDEEEKIGSSEDYN